MDVSNGKEESAGVKISPEQPSLDLAFPHDLNLRVEKERIFLSSPRWLGYFLRWIERYTQFMLEI